ncbi:putative Zn(II)2Cys6 transcription factor [Aspergillus mulundensis]|uniref:Putative Zn(II)2Cys6 transcription factor n=1 Tax=Aspergillus mulundensis TaxID=1810919 RepID=A0A3D8R474_9EURO|nr:putative Zn(II)2Cys6 transcription factor [Aspergillus mulundensis]RDW68862.1 putative Zn(II)2Cys6 transcription factor [Aspergillus mulundensis]
MDARSGETAAKVRKVRKGTHSCRECRRRKVKCIFASANDDVCIICRRRGTKCVSQGDVGFGRRLESPGLPPTPVSARLIPITEPAIRANTTNVLLQALPCPEDIELLLGKTSSPTEMLREQISIPSLLHPESHPVLLGRQMLLFAAALQHVSPTATIPGLTEHHRMIMERLAETTIRTVTTNDELLGTLEGLENIILEAFYHIDSGNIRRAWITMRRAVMAAQLMGLHHPGQYRFKLISDRNGLDPAIMWACIVSMERAMSLLLGLPTSTGDVTPEVRNTHDNIHTLVVHMTSRILHRNQLDASQQSTRDLTKEIDLELIQLTEQLPSSFWRPPALAGLEMDSAEAFWEARRATDHMCYYMLLSQLHLPYVLCPSHTPHVIYSRLSCLTASREILARQIAIRTFNPITAWSRMGDFLALTAGMTLMLIHIVSHGHKDVDNGSLLIHERLRDRARVEQALDCMKSMSELHEDVLAAKCAVMLKDLLAIEAAAAQGRRACSADKDDRAELSIQVPHLGMVRIAPGGITFMPHSKIGHNLHPTEGAGVTIGGIGSIRVQGLSSPPSSEHHTNNCNSGATCDIPAIHVPTTVIGPQSVDELPPTDYSLPEDRMFPDAAAGMDDWVFQGFDTAFFDTLTRGLGEQPLGELT